MNKSDFIANDITNKIIQNVYKPNKKLPTEREMVKLYNASRYSIRQALEKLENIGFIYKVQGSGIFVGDAVHNNNFMYNSMTQNKFSNIRSEIIRFEEIEITYELSRLFNVPSPTFWQFERVRIIDSQKVQIETTTLPKALFPRFSEEIAKGSIHNYVSSLGFEISHLATEYLAINLNQNEAKILESKRGGAAMKIKNHGYLVDNVLFELSESVNLNYSCSHINDYNLNVHQLREREIRK